MVIRYVDAAGFQQQVRPVVTCVMLLSVMII